MQVPLNFEKIPMRTRLYAFLAVPAAAALLAFSPSDAPPQEDFRWSGTVAAGKWIEIKGVNGAISAEPASGNQVEVTAVKRDGRRGRPEDVRIERVMHDGGVTICAVYPSGRRNRPNRCTAGDSWPPAWRGTTCGWSGWCGCPAASTSWARR